MIMRRWWGFRSAVPAMVVAVAGFLGQGCQSVEHVAGGGLFETVTERPLADVPVPDGLRFEESGSYVFNRNFRVARLFYRGTGDLRAIEGFYKEQMPLSRWTFVRASGIQERVIEFQSKLETCTVTLKRLGGASSLDIEISPRKA